MAEYGNGVVARLERAQEDIRDLRRDKADKDDLRRLEDELKGIRREVAGLREDWRKSNEHQPWTRGQKLAAVAVVMTCLVGIGSMLVTLLAATG